MICFWTKNFCVRSNDCEVIAPYIEMQYNNVYYKYILKLLL